MSHFANSIGFLINASYTFTLANALFLMVALDPNKSPSLDNIQFDLKNLVCGGICFIVALRFYLGNNNYIFNVFASKNKSPWKKMYHLIFILAEGVFILLLSYAVQKYISFIGLIAILFWFEVVWYAITLFVDPDSLNESSGTIDLGFLKAQMTNLILALGASALYVFKVEQPQSIVILALLFATNTGFDLRENASTYVNPT